MPRLVTWSYSTQTGYMIADVEGGPDRYIQVAWIMPTFHAAALVPEWVEMAYHALGLE